MSHRASPPERPHRAGEALREGERAARGATDRVRGREQQKKSRNEQAQTEARRNEAGLSSEARNRSLS